MGVLIPVNTEFYCAKTNTTIFGNGLNQFPSEFELDDILRTDYYSYKFRVSPISSGWCVRALSTRRKYYPPIAEEIRGYPIISLVGAFSGCTHMVQSPEIPHGVKDMTSAYADCHFLLDPPVIPDGVDNMNSAFYACRALSSAPAIPESVANLRNAFDECTALGGTFVCNSTKVTPITVSDALRNTKITAVDGRCSDEIKQLFLQQLRK